MFGLAPGNVLRIEESMRDSPSHSGARDHSHQNLESRVHCRGAYELCDLVIEFNTIEALISENQRYSVPSAT